MDVCDQLPCAYTVMSWKICQKGSELDMKRFYRPRLKSSRPISPLRRTFWLDELLRRRRLRDSAGSLGLSPVARACRFRMSVRLITPTRRPDNRAPSSADDGMECERLGGIGTPDEEIEGAVEAG